MRTAATWFGVFGVLFLVIGLVLGIARVWPGLVVSIAGYRVLPGLVMLLGIVCLLICLVAAGALRQDDGDRG
jgi:hypothetical protein